MKKEDGHPARSERGARSSHGPWVVMRKEDGIHFLDWWHLHLFAWLGNHKGTALQLDWGADPNGRNRDRGTPLHAVAAAGQGHRVDAVLNVDDFHPSEHWFVFHLMGLAENEHLEVAALLLDRGADIEAQDDDGWTPLDWAAAEGHLETVDLLRERGAVD